MLITPLDSMEFISLCKSMGAGDIAAALNDGRLNLFTAVGDYAVNLFMHGARRYVHELDHFLPASSCFVLIDQADDLFSPHDHVAVVDQARTYREWCERHGHKMLLLFLRTARGRPMLDGNQAPARYFDGMAHVFSAPDGIRLKVDYWSSPAGCQSGSSVTLDPLFGAPPVNAGGFGGDLRPTGEERVVKRRGVHATRPDRRREVLLYFGPENADLAVPNDLFQLQIVASINDLLYLATRRKRRNILLGFDENTKFRDLLVRVASLRKAIGNGTRLVIWESRYRLREHLEKKLLLCAGADCVLPSGATLGSLPLLLKESRSGIAIRPYAKTTASTEQLLAYVAGCPESAWLPAANFVHEAQEALHGSAQLQIPCVLAELQYDCVVESGPAGGHALGRSRKGDFLTTARDAEFLFLRGCRDHNVAQVVARRVGEKSPHSLQRISLFSTGAAIVARLDRLQKEATGAGVSGQMAPGVGASNVLSLARVAEITIKQGHAGMAFLAMVATVFLLWQVPPECQAEEDPPEQGEAVTPSWQLFPPHEPMVPVRGALKAYEEARYADAAQLGLIQLQQDQDDHELRFKVANSLAWSGQYREAIRQYQALDGTPVADAAALGLAYVHLWDGHPELADPLFRRSLNADPDNAEARQGLAAAGRHLRPRTTLRLGSQDDSSNTERPALRIAHRWRDTDLIQVFEVATEAGRESRSPDGPKLDQREVAFSYEHLGLPLSPRLQMAAQESPTTKLFGSAAVKLGEGAATLDVGRVNWGKMVFDPQALRDGLTANRAGFEGLADSGAGRWHGSYAYYAVSDGNRMHDLNARYTPSWQPFPHASGLRAFIGLYGRKAGRTSPHYWSPEPGFYTGNLGLALDRWEDDWNLSVELRRSLRLGGEGAGGWSAGAGGKRWLNSDWAVGADAFYLETRRGESAYRSGLLIAALEHLW